MKILIVTTRFFPYGSAISGVVGNLTEAFISLGCEVKIIALTRYKNDAISENWKGASVKKIYAPEIITKEQLKSEFKEFFFRSAIGFLIKAMNKITQKIVPYYSKYSVERSILKRYKKALKKELKNNYDLCISTLMPIEAVIAGTICKKKETAFAIYQLDPYWNNADLPLKKENLRLAYEKRLVMYSDYCMTAPAIFKTNTEKIRKLKKKYVITEFPCLKEVKMNMDNTKSDKIHCVFLGTLYPELRPPERLLEIISYLKNDAVFDFYGSGQYLIEESDYYKDLKSKVNLMGQVASDKAEKAREKADILINIDNTSVTLVPSKIFEYVSTGKPIINCYFSEKSLVLDYLKRYPLCLNVCMQSDAKENADKIDDFIKSLNGERIPFSDVKLLYKKNTPEYVAKQFLEAFDNVNIKA